MKFGGFKGGMGGGMPNMQALMKQAQKMQEDIATAKEEIENTVLTGTSGGGMVVVEINGNKKVNSLKLKPEIVDPDDIEMLEDLIIAALSDAFTKADELNAKLLPNVGI